MNAPFITVLGIPLEIENIFNNQTAFLIGGGPSFKHIKKESLKLAWTMTLNNATASFRGNAHCVADAPNRFSLSMWLDSTIQKFVPSDHLNQTLWDNRLIEKNGKWIQQWKSTELKVCDCPNVVGYLRNDIFRPVHFLREPTINWGVRARDGGGKSVMLPALRILYLLGFRKVYLLGVDFSMQRDEPYHFPEERSRMEIAGNIQLYRKLERWLSVLQPYFLAANFVVKNCNAASNLKVFPFASFDEAIGEAKAPLGDYTRERTRGMYKRLEDGKLEVDC